MFLIANDPNISAVDLNHDFGLISQWAYQWKMSLNHDFGLISQCAYQWKMSFNPNPNKQAVQEVFSRKSKQQDHPEIYLNDIEVKTVNNVKHLTLDS